MGRWMAALAVGISLIHATPGDIELSARVEPSEILVGEPISYVITVTRPARMRADLPSARGNTGRLDVEGHRVTVDTLPDGRVRETHALALTAWMPGDDTLPAQRVEIRADIRAGGDTAATVLYTPPTAVTVRATAKDGSDIADIRDAERLPGAFPWALPLVLVAAAALWYGIRRESRRRKRRPTPAPAMPARVPTPQELALARLLALETDAPPSREFAFALSEILRGYLAARYGVDALEATTEELLERARSLPVAIGRKEWLREFCATLDRAKFADARLAPADASRLLAEARGFVAESTPTARPVDANPQPDEGRAA
jgi:hypothetical protein